MSEKKHPEQELNDDELDAVAGGLDINNGQYRAPVAVNINQDHLVAPEVELGPIATIDPLAVNINNSH